VTRLDKIEGGFQVEWGAGCVTARKVLLATGVTNRRPPMDPKLHDDAMARGLIRYCPVCDGYEVTDKKVAVIGTGTKGVSESVFLRGFTQDITLIAPDGPHELEADDKARIAQFGITCIDGPCTDIVAGDGTISVMTHDGSREFDSIYPALGSDTHTELAKQVGVEMAEDGTLPVDDHQRTSVEGLYAAGDVVLGLDQISHAMGEGGVAATTMRNDLAKERPIIRERLRGNSML
jgi:thioredoxin reductase (NADPH)